MDLRRLTEVICSLVTTLCRFQYDVAAKKLYQVPRRLCIFTLVYGQYTFCINFRIP